MKRILSCLFAFLFLAGALAGCTAKSSGADDQGKLSVTTSFYPLYDFAKKVGGERISLTNLTPAGTEPHDWEPTSKDIIRLEKADVFLYNGAGMEHWVDQVLATLSSEKLLSVEVSQGISLLDETEDVSGKPLMSVDPHIWLSIPRAKEEMRTIKEAFCKADPEGASIYEANYQKYAAEFDALDAEFRETLGALPNKNIVVAHQAFSYLCADYGLNQVAIEGLAADSEPDPARMKEIIDFARENGVKVIYFEELVSPKVAETIAAEIGAKTAVLNPLEGLTQEQLDKGEDYLSIMRQNLATLEAENQ